MPALGITGGIATGKSTFSQLLCRYLPAELFDADQCSRELLSKDPDIRQAVLAAFGARAFSDDGLPDRVWLREVVFADAAKRQVLEQILHPAIRNRWSSAATQAGQIGRWYCVDIPLLYETAAQKHFAAVVVVACSPTTQRQRLTCQRHVPETIAEQIIVAQLDLGTKIAQADHIIWNDSTNSCLDRQARLLVGALRRHYG